MTNHTADEVVVDIIIHPRRCHTKHYLAVFVILPKLPRSFRNIIKPSSSLLTAFQNQSQLIHTNHERRPKATPHRYYLFHWLWLLKALERLLKGFVIIPNDQGIPCYPLLIKQTRNCHLCAHAYQHRQQGHGIISNPENARSSTLSKWKELQTIENEWSETALYRHNPAECAYRKTKRHSLKRHDCKTFIRRL